MDNCSNKSFGFSLSDLLIKYSLVAFRSFVFDEAFVRLYVNFVHSLFLCRMVNTIGFCMFYSAVVKET